MSLQAIAIPAQTQPPKGLFVALHGWGANAQDLVGLAPMMRLPDYQLLFPDAPFPYPYSSEGRVWYNFPANYTFQSHPNFANEPELHASRQRLKDWLLSLPDLTGVPLQNTVLAGFSQGGAMTIDVGTQLPLGALLVLSGYLHAPLTSPISPPPPILMVHGRWDQVVPLQAAHQARDALLHSGANVEYHELEMGHEIQLEVLNLIQNFMAKQAINLGETA